MDVGEIELGTGAVMMGVCEIELGIGNDGLGSQTGELDVVSNGDLQESFEMQNACTIGTNTNNRIEGLWKQLKELVDSFMGVDDCILVTESGELGAESHELGTMNDVDSNPAALELRGESDTTVGGQVSTIALTGTNDDFQIESPTKVKGTPEEEFEGSESKAKHDYYHGPRGYGNTSKSVKSTYSQSSPKPTINSFRSLSIATPDCPRVAKLHRTKPLLRPEEIVRVLPVDLIGRCMAKVKAFQNKRPWTLETQLTLEVGVFANSTVALMRRWYDAMKAVKKNPKSAGLDRAG
ncbi:hypothetical protein GQ600_6697 [Phytophthora cactorum]|nr:hypothetical protein GQ600_6697 [Phytophthora cactorum]